MAARTFIDEEGLTRQGNHLRRFTVALGVGGEPVRSRVGLLARLIHGAGVTIYTGPEGAPFWSLASQEVKVRIVPDGDDYDYRTTSYDEWAYRAVGVPTAATGQLLKRKTPPPASHRWFRHWNEAQTLLRLLADEGTPEAIIEEDFPTEAISLQDSIDILAGNDDPLALDWEWDMDTAEPIGLAMADSASAKYAVLRASDVDYPTESGALLVDEFSNYLRNGGPAILHGGRADLGVQYHGNPLDLMGKNIDDTMVMAYLAGEPVLALKELTRKFLGRDPTDFPGNLSSLPAALGTRYAAADGRNTYDLFSALARILVERNQWGVYQEIEKPLIPVIVSMEREGVPVDIEEVKRQYRECVTLEQGMRYAILHGYGFDVSKDSGKTLRDNQARQFVAQCRGSDPGTMDQRLLTTFPEGEIDLLLFYRRHRTLRRNFLGRALRYFYAATHPGHEHHLFKSRSRWTKTGKLTDLGKFLEWRRRWLALETPTAFRYFPRYNQAGSVDGDNHAAPRSGRLSSTDPNFTNQTRGALRKTYVAPEDHDWWSFDYSGLELHLMADISQDSNALRILSEVCPDGVCTHKPKHGDLHGFLQYRIQDATGSTYDRALVVKPANFMEIYGGSPSKLVEIVAKSRYYITLETATVIHEGHQESFSEFWDFRERRLALNRGRGYAETIYGRRRYIPELHSRDSERLAYGDRAGFNHEIQGSGADIVKRTMVGVVPVLRKFGAHMAAQVHDEIDGWLPKNVDHAEFKGEIERIMQITLPNGLQLKVEGGFGPNWGDAH